MRWPWSNRADDHGSGLRAREESAEGLAQASDSLHEVTSKWDEVHRVADSLRELRSRNQFAEQIQMTMRNPDL